MCSWLLLPSEYPKPTFCKRKLLLLFGCRAKKKQGVHYELTRQGEKREEDEMRGVERGTRRLCLLGIQERSDIDKDSSMVALRGGPERKKDFFLLPLSCMFATPVSHAVTNNSFAQDERRRREHVRHECLPGPLSKKRGKWLLFREKKGFIAFQSRIQAFSPP